MTLWKTTTWSFKSHQHNRQEAGRGRLEPAIRSEEKPSGTKNYDSPVVIKDSRPTQAIETKVEIQLLNRDDTLGEEYEIIEHNVLVEEGYVFVWESSTESSRSMRR